MNTENKIEDGGPAFPVPDVCHPNGQVQYGANGMTLRDLFAGQALAGIMSSDGRPDGDQNKADWAYDIADAMIEAGRAK
jgi:hypothetical protein